jgi:hypothetical protein
MKTNNKNLDQSRKYAKKILKEVEYVVVYWNEGEDKHIFDIDKLIEASVKYDFSLEDLYKHEDLYWGNTLIDWNGKDEQLEEWLVSHDREEFCTPGDDIVGGIYLFNS